MTAAFLGGLLLLGALSACGSGGEDEREATPTLTPEPSALIDLDRYHYLTTLWLRGTNPDGSTNDVVVTTEGDYEAPDRHSFTYTTQIPGAATKIGAVVIGDKIWLRNGNDPWHESGTDDPQARRLLSVTFSPINPGFLGGQSFRQAREAVQRLPNMLEFVNEVRAYHYSVGAAGARYFDQLLAQDPGALQLEDMKWDAWLAQDGSWPVRLQATGTVTNDIPILQDLNLSPPTGWTLRVDISRPNDPAVTVQAPM